MMLDTSKQRRTGDKRGKGERVKDEQECNKRRRVKREREREEGGRDGGEGENIREPQSKLS